MFFGIITRQAIRRGSYASVPELVAAIETFIDGWNERCHPFVWTKTADEILPHARKRDFRRGTPGAGLISGQTIAEAAKGAGFAERTTRRDSRTPAFRLCFGWLRRN